MHLCMCVHVDMYVNVAPSNVRSYIYKVLQTRQLNHELNKDSTNGLFKLDGGEAYEDSTPTEERRKTSSGRACLPQGRAYQLAVQYQRIISENTYK